jgi:hypothetical protein
MCFQFARLHVGLSGFSRPDALNEIGISDNVWKPCRIDTFGYLPSGELTAEIFRKDDVFCKTYVLT